MTPAEIAAQHGHSFFLLAQKQPHYAPAAIEHLRDAVDGFGPTYMRSRAVNLPGLAWPAATSTSANSTPLFSSVTKP